MSLTKTLNSYSFVYIPTETEKLIPYATLQEKLGLESIREVEDLIIEGIITCALEIKIKTFKKHYIEVISQVFLFQ